MKFENTVATDECFVCYDLRTTETKMSLVQIILISFFGGVTVYFELRDIQEWSLFGNDLFGAVQFYALCILIIVYLFKNSREYREHKAGFLSCPQQSDFCFWLLLLATCYCAHITTIFRHVLL